MRGTAPAHARGVQVRQLQEGKGVGPCVSVIGATSGAAVGGFVGVIAFVVAAAVVDVVVVADFVIAVIVEVML